MRLATVLLAVLALASAGTAQAQTLVVPAGTARPDGELGARLGSAADDAGFEVAPADRAVERIGLSSVGSPPAELVAELGRTAETVLELVASGEGEAAIARGAPVLERAERHLAAVGSQAQAATDLANLCLYLVRAELGQGGEDAAAARARGCWRLVPDLPVDERLHPPDVRQLVRRVRSDIDAGRTVLSLRAAPGAPEGCAIRLNGRPIGETPEVRRAVVPGRYAVGASCAEGASVARTVAASEGEAQRVLLHPRLETALRITAGGPWLVYASADAARERAALDAGELARLAGAPEALVAVRSGRGVEIRRVVVEASGPARVVGETTAASTGDDDLAAAMTRLRRGGPAVAVSGGAALDGDAGSGPPILGPVLLGTAGLGALAVLTVGLIDQGCIDEAADGTCLEERSLNTPVAIAVGAAGGGAVLGAVLWLILGGGSGEADEERAVDVAVGPRGLDVAVSF